MNKKVLWTGVAAGALVLGAVTGGTFAAWSDFDVDEETIMAGHLTLNVGQSVRAANGDPLRLAPGSTAYRTFYISSNDGQSVPNGNLSVTMLNLVDGENGCENNGEADAESPARADGAGINPLDTDGDIDPTRCDDVGDLGELSKVTSMQWRWTEPLSATTDCDALATYPGEGGEPSGDYKYVNAAASGFIGNMDNIPTPIETLAPGQGICTLLTINIQNPAHPSTVVHHNASQGDSLDFDLRFDLNQA